MYMYLTQCFQYEFTEKGQQLFPFRIMRSIEILKAVARKAFITILLIRMHFLTRQGRSQSNHKLILKWYSIFLPYTGLELK